MERPRRTRLRQVAFVIAATGIHFGALDPPHQRDRSGAWEAAVQRGTRAAMNRLWVCPFPPGTFDRQGASDEIAIQVISCFAARDRAVPCALRELSDYAGAREGNTALGSAGEIRGCAGASTATAGLRILVASEALGCKAAPPMGVSRLRRRPGGNELRAERSLVRIPGAARGVESRGLHEVRPPG